MNFPNGFKVKYQHLLGEDAAAFATFDQRSRQPFRTNPLKEAQKYLMIRFPVLLWGHYGKGLREIHRTPNRRVYSWEPAAQMVDKSPAKSLGWGPKPPGVTSFVLFG